MNILLGIICFLGVPFWLFNFWNPNQVSRGFQQLAYIMAAVMCFTASMKMFTNDAVFMAYFGG